MDRNDEASVADRMDIQQKEITFALCVCVCAPLLKKKHSLFYTSLFETLLYKKNGVFGFLSTDFKTDIIEHGSSLTWMVPGHIAATSASSFQSFSARLSQTLKGSALFSPGKMGN